MKKILILIVVTLILSGCQTIKQKIIPFVVETGKEFHEFNERYCSEENLTLRLTLLAGIRMVAPAYPSEGFCGLRNIFLDKYNYCNNPNKEAPQYPVDVVFVH